MCLFNPIEIQSSVVGVQNLPPVIQNANGIPIKAKPCLRSFSLPQMEKQTIKDYRSVERAI